MLGHVNFFGCCQGRRSRPCRPLFTSPQVRKVDLIGSALFEASSVLRRLSVWNQSHSSLGDIALLLFSDTPILSILQLHVFLGTLMAIGRLH